MENWIYIFVYYSETVEHIKLKKELHNLQYLALKHSVTMAVLCGQGSLFLWLTIKSVSLTIFPWTKSNINLEKREDWILMNLYDKEYLKYFKHEQSMPD